MSSWACKAAVNIPINADPLVICQEFGLSAEFSYCSNSWSVRTTIWAGFGWSGPVSGLPWPLTSYPPLATLRPMLLTLLLR